MHRYSKAIVILASSTPVIVPIVAPMSGDPGNSGRVVNVPATPQIHVRWLEKSSSGEWIIRSEHARKGWALLEDLYAAERNPEGWVRYQRYISKWQAGTTKSSFPKEWLPQEVIRRQSCGDDPDFADEFASPPTTGASAKLKAPSNKVAAKLLSDLSKAPE